jgi:hypothetical protein
MNPELAQIFALFGPPGKTGGHCASHEPSRCRRYQIPKTGGSSLTKRNEEIAAFFVANGQRVFEESSAIFLNHVKNED